MDHIKITQIENEDPEHSDNYWIDPEGRTRHLNNEESDLVQQLIKEFNDNNSKIENDWGEIS